MQEVAVIRAADDKFGETPAAIIVGEVDVDAVVSHCNAQLADIKVPRYVVVRDKPLPRLPNQKLDKMAIRAEYENVAELYPKVR